MASIYKRRRRVKLGGGKTVTRQSGKWHIKYADADGIERRVVGFTDKMATVQLAASLEKEAALAKAGVVDRFKEHRRRPLAEHLSEYKANMLHRGTTGKQARLVHKRVKAIIDGCGFMYINDISPSKMQRYLADRRQGGLSIRTSNFYVQAMKQFCQWMVADNRAGENVVAHLKGQNPNVDLRHSRRSLEPNEIRRLLDATAASATRFGMSGYERCLLYRFATETGLRANEVRNLVVGDFDFENLTVTVKAAYSKHRREDQLPLRPDTAVELAQFLKAKLPEVHAFGGSSGRLTQRTSEMMKADLADAGIPYVDDAGRYADFHSLRHTCGSLLAASGVHPKVAQSIMRHSDINLTMSRYTHTLVGQEAEAVARLPNFYLPSAGRQVATGTDGGPADSEPTVLELTPDLTPRLIPTADPDSTKSAAIGMATTEIAYTALESKSFSNKELDARNARLSFHGNNGAGGIRTPGAFRHSGFQDRRLKPLGHRSRRCRVLGGPVSARPGPYIRTALYKGIVPRQPQLGECPAKDPKSAPLATVGG